VTVSVDVLEDQYGSGAYLKRDLQIARGEGAYLWDTSGNRYLDCVAGQGTANLGHRHPEVVAAIKAQMDEIMICPELFHFPLRGQYQAALCNAAGMARVFLCNSGAEANEGALKAAKLLTGRSGIISTMRGFHGRTIGALSATWEKKYREPFEPLLPNVTHVPYNKPERIEAALTDDTAAVMIEVVQGEGGVHPAEDGYLQVVQDLCRKNGTLLIVDEVQTGFGRTGYLFAHEQDGIQPDIMTVGKSIAGGIPMGAVLMSERLDPLPPASHGSTFGGNPVACAAALKTLEILQNTDLIETARERGTAILEDLRENLPPDKVRDVRGRGYMIGIELRGKVAPVLRALQDQGVVALPAGPNVLRLLPPLVIDEDDLRTLVRVVKDVLSNDL
jgi:acetylornithine/LysW-gamma-L-lysine aminotransferase